MSDPSNRPRIPFCSPSAPIRFRIDLVSESKDTRSDHKSEAKQTAMRNEVQQVDEYNAKKNVIYYHRDEIGSIK